MSRGLRIRRARESRGLSQRELAELIGTTERTVIRWEKDQHNPTGSLGRALETALGAEPGEYVVETSEADRLESLEARVDAIERLAEETEALVRRALSQDESRSSGRRKRPAPR